MPNRFGTAAVAIDTMKVMRVPRHLLAATGSLLAALAWGFHLASHPDPWTEEAAMVLAVGLVAGAVVAMVAIIVQHSRLGYRLAWAPIGLTVPLLVWGSITWTWWVGVVVTVVAVVALADRRLGGWLRAERPPAPIPKSALAVVFMLLAAGPATALVVVGQPQRWLPWLTAAAWVLVLAYVRRWPGRVWLPRLIIPLLTLAGLGLSSPGRWVWMACLGAAGVSSWTRGARLAVQPLLTRGQAVLIPPELAPPEVLRSFRQRPTDR
jgi:hypothetical protein